MNLKILKEIDNSGNSAPLMIGYIFANANQMTYNLAYWKYTNGTVFKLIKWMCVYNLDIFIKKKLT